MNNPVDLKRDLLDDDGENLAVRTFLQLYGGTNSPSIEGMRDHLEMSGFDGCWPEWAATQFGFLTKGGAQNWLRYLFALEGATAASGAVPEWMPIETAPKKGRSLILLLTPSGWPQVAYSNTWWTSGFSVESKPTRWMPLPPASNADKPKDAFPPDWEE